MMLQRAAVLCVLILVAAEAMPQFYTAEAEAVSRKKRDTENDDEDGFYWPFFPFFGPYVGNGYAASGVGTGYAATGVGTGAKAGTKNPPFKGYPKSWSGSISSSNGPYYRDNSEGTWPGYSFWPFWPMWNVPHIVPWYEGPNICTETKPPKPRVESTAVTGDDDDDDDDDDFWFQSAGKQQMCHDDGNMNICRIWKTVNGKSQKYTVKKKCCDGFTRNYQGPGCIESDGAAAPPVADSETQADNQPK